MSDKPEIRKRTGQTSRIQKASPPSPEPEAAAPQKGTQRRPGAGPTRKSHAGERLVKTKEGPSKIGRLIKITLVLIVVVGIPGIIGASFFVKVGKSKKKTVAQAVIDIVKKKLGMEVPPEKAEIKEAKADKKHPKVAQFDATILRIRSQQITLKSLSQQLAKRDATQPWTPEEGLPILDKLEASSKEIKEVINVLDELTLWIKTFNEKKGLAESIYEKFRGDEKKKMAADTGVLGTIPEEFKEAGEDPEVKEYIRICQEIEHGKYTETLIPDEQFNDVARDAQSIMKEIRGMIAKVPNRKVLSGEEPPPPAPAPAPKPAPPAAFNAKTLHAWAAAKPGTWVRLKTTLQGKVTYEDRIVKDVNDEAVVFAGFKHDGEKAVESPETTEKFVDGEVKVHPDEPVKVGEQEMLCAVVEVGATKSWVVKSGPGAGRIWLKRVRGNREDLVTSVALEPVALKGEDKECIAAETKSGKMWFREDVPGLLVKFENPQVRVELVDWGTDPAARPEFPAAATPKPPEPAPAPALAMPKRPEPWGAFRKGAWVREKALTPAGEVWTDTSVEEVTDAAATLKIETRIRSGAADSRTVPVPFVGADQAKAIREEKLKVGEAEIACVVAEAQVGPAVRRFWIPKDGPAAALAIPLKVEGGADSSTVVELSEGTAKVGEAEVKVLKVRSAGKVEGGGDYTLEAWYSADVPGFKVRHRMEQGAQVISSETVAFGADVATRPALPAEPEKPKEPPKPAPVAEPVKPAEPKPAEPVKPAEKTVDDILKEADASIMEGVGFYKQVSSAMDKLPDDPEKLKILLQKKEQANACFMKAKETYVGLGERVPASANAAKKLNQLEVLMGNLKKFEDGIKSKLK